MSTRSSTSSLPRIESRFGTLSNTTEAIAVAAERWNIEKKRAEYDSEIESFYNKQVAKCLNIDKVANEKITKLYNEIYYKVKWSNPPLPSTQQKLFTDYCKHLLTEGAKVKFSGVVDLKVWKKKLTGTVHEKLCDELTSMCKKLRDTVHRRDTDLCETQAQLLTTTEKLNVKKDGTLRWMMEKNTGKKDEVFTIWYYAMNGKMRELEVLLKSKTSYQVTDINARDPDFGLTPLHYACKTVRLSMVKFLMERGADIHLRTPDGRTCLHLAGAYSTREIVLELLGACIDYDAVDNYGCTALQMAKQNQNGKALETLQNWNYLTLLPSEREKLDATMIGSKANKSFKYNTLEGSASTAGPSLLMGFDNKSGFLEQESSAYAFPNPVSPQHSLVVPDSPYPFSGFAIPDEFQQTPPAVVSAMSPALALLTKRLNAYNRFLVRTEANYVPTEMLRSRDLSRMSELLGRNADSYAYQLQQLQQQHQHQQSRGYSGEVSMAARSDGDGDGDGGGGGGGPASLHQSPHIDADVNVDAVGSVLHIDLRTTSGVGDVGFSPVQPDHPGSVAKMHPGTWEQAQFGAEGTAQSHASRSLGGGGGGTAFLENSVSTVMFEGQSAFPQTEGSWVDNYSSEILRDERIDFASEFNECLVEIRLTGKHYLLCVQENFIPEAMRSLKRRWLVAKRLWGLVVAEKRRREQAEQEQRRQQALDMAALLQEQEQEQGELRVMDNGTGFYEGGAANGLEFGSSTSLGDRIGVECGAGSNVQVQAQDYPLQAAGSRFLDASEVAVDYGLPNIKYLTSSASSYPDDISSVGATSSGYVPDAKGGAGAQLAARYGSVSTSSQSFQGPGQGGKSPNESLHQSGLQAFDGQQQQQQPLPLSSSASKALRRLRQQQSPTNDVLTFPSQVDWNSGSSRHRGHRIVEEDEEEEDEEEDEGEEGNEEGSGSSSVASSSSSSAYVKPPLDLETIARLYAKDVEDEARATNNPEVESQSSASLRRPNDYDSLGTNPNPNPNPTLTPTLP
jgi:hypothetical protein